MKTNLTFRYKYITIIITFIIIIIIIIIVILFVMVLVVLHTNRSWILSNAWKLKEKNIRIEEKKNNNEKKLRNGVWQCLKKVSRSHMMMTPATLLLLLYKYYNNNIYKYMPQSAMSNVKHIFLRRGDLIVNNQ